MILISTATVPIALHGVAQNGGIDAKTKIKEKIMSYAIGPARQGVNNICEDIFNGGQQYIQPVTTQQQVQQVTQPFFQAPPPLVAPESTPFPIYKLPTVTYTPETLRTHFEPLNPGYNNSFLGR
jgi:hypothetical protein